MMGMDFGIEGLHGAFAYAEFRMDVFGRGKLRADDFSIVSK